MVALYELIQKRKFFHIEMASRSAVTALDRLNHIIDATFSNIVQLERFDRYTTLQSLYTALDRGRWVDEAAGI